ncbi:MAG: hypothetical protein BWK75_03300 [Candidatus Altiarchaeales archaeon A3]|nr:MAG: hypothetical protein BWK75_03300 [Candidatus Altiarchaeales archaeon A3]
MRGVKIIRKLIFLVLRFTLIPFFIREIIQRKKVTIILYHNIKPNTLDMHFKVLNSKYNIITLKNFLEARISGKVNDLPPKSLIITLDDGYKENYKLKTILKKYNMRPTIFLCGGIVGTKRHFWDGEDCVSNNRDYLKTISNKKRLEFLREFGFEEEKEFGDRVALSNNEIEELKDIVDFQSHSMFHPVLPNCSCERAYNEISQSKKYLEHNYGFEIYALSYPNGNYSDREISMAKKAGYACGITVDVGFNSQNTDIFRLKRMSIADDADINELLVKACGLWWYIRKIFDYTSQLHKLSIFKNEVF